MDHKTRALLEVVLMHRASPRVCDITPMF